MRTIKFRGKPLPVDDLEDEYKVEQQECLLASLPVNMYDGSFVYGSLVFDTNGSPYIVGELIEVNDDYTCLHYWIPVIPETVGQFTVNSYKDGREAYDGDIFKCSSGCNHIIEYIQEHGGTYGGGMPSFYPSGLNNGYAWIGVEEYVGNVHDNPELLK